MAEFSGGWHEELWNPRDFAEEGLAAERRRRKRNLRDQKEHRPKTGPGLYDCLRESIKVEIAALFWQKLAIPSGRNCRFRSVDSKSGKNPL